MTHYIRGAVKRQKIKAREQRATPLVNSAFSLA
jgi:hypothetical protein